MQKRGREMLLETPVKDEIKTLKAGDIVRLTGEIITARDMAHRRLVEEDAKLPVDFNVIYHCGPLVKKENGWKMISCGPTTSSRMDRYTKAMVERFGMHSGLDTYARPRQFPPAARRSRFGVRITGLPPQPMWSRRIWSVVISSTFIGPAI